MGLVQVIESYGVELRRGGKELVGLCPFHDDHHPSLNVNPDKEIWHCFGCQAGGDTATFVMKMEGVDFKAALKILGEEPLPKPPPRPRPEIAWGREILNRLDAVLREINQRLWLAEQLDWTEEIELLQRQYSILETMAEDLANKELLPSLFNERELIERILAIEEV